jgi:hypothetical protein
MTERMTDTPRTDAVAGSDPMCDGHWDQPQIVELASLARQLERELAEARARLREAMELWGKRCSCVYDTYGDFVACDRCKRLDALRIEGET